MLDVVNRKERMLGLLLGYHRLKERCGERYRVKAALEPLHRPVERLWLGPSRCAHL